MKHWYLLAAAAFGCALNQTSGFCAALPPVLSVQARSDKLYYTSKEPITADVAIANGTDQQKTVRLTVWLESGLDERTKTSVQTAQVAPNTTGHAEFRWPAHALGIYGYALRCTADDMTPGAPMAAPKANGTSTVSGAGSTASAPAVLQSTDYFTICDNYWNVALSSSHPIGYTAGSFPKQIDSVLANLRADYYNGFEIFFWAPDDFAKMTPDKPIYYSGQVRYHESVANLQYEIAAGHRLGMCATTYGKNIGSGSAGEEFAREHPEMVYREGGRLNMQAKVRALYYWDKDVNWDGKPGQNWQETNWVFYNMNDPAVIDYGSDEIARSATMFGWDGVRFDGHYAAADSWYDDNGQLHKLTPAQRDAQTAANVKRMKERIRRVHPNFYFGYNYLNGSATAALANSPLELRELASGGGHIMNEYIGQATDVNHPLHHWHDFGALMANDSAVVRGLGGFYFPILHYTGVAQDYADAIAYASDAHPYYSHIWGAFATRYAGVLWDTALHPLKSPDQLLQVPASVWWTNFVEQRDLDKRHQQVVVHLINPPKNEDVSNDKTQTLPDPLNNVELQVNAAALGKNWTLTKATVLDPDSVTQTELPVTTSGTTAKVTVAQVPVWKVLVLDFSKG